MLYLIEGFSSSAIDDKSTRYKTDRTLKSSRELTLYASPNNFNRYEDQSDW